MQMLPAPHCSSVTQGAQKSRGMQREPAPLAASTMRQPMCAGQSRSLLQLVVHTDSAELSGSFTHSSLSPHRVPSGSGAQALPMLASTARTQTARLPSSLEHCSATEPPVQSALDLHGALQ